MKQKTLHILLRLWIIFAIALFTGCNNSNTKNSDTESEYSSDESSDEKDTLLENVEEKEIVKDKFIDIRKKEIKLTKHARCRMDCRSITTGDIKTVLQRGKIVPKKSKLSTKPYRYCFEAMVKGRKLHVIFVDYPQYVRIITVINKSSPKDAPECSKCK